MKTSILFLVLSLSTVSADTTRVFIGTGDVGIHTTLLDTETGTLTEPMLAATINGSGFIVVHPNQQFLYSTGETDRQTGAVYAYAIQPDGSLKALGHRDAGGKRLCYVGLDASAKILMAANYGEGNVVSFPIKDNGQIGKLVSLIQHQGLSVHPERQTKPHAHSIYSGPNNKFAYAPDLGIDKVMIYAIEPDTARLTPIGFASSPKGSGPRHMKFGKNGKYAFVLNELSLSISVYEQNPVSGKLIPIQVINTLPEGESIDQRTSSEIRVSHDGQFIYCANRDLSEQGRDSLSVFNMGNDGTLTRIQTIGAEVRIPRNINIDPSGKWLLVAGQKSSEVAVFKTDSTGGQLSFTGHKIKVPRAMCIEFKN